ncbi:MAG TPA: type II toxin-antitoxin system VapC family toxin, partial [Aequorivita sp.]|nr:type II toxin-antitoxin system VapC family toxin [Aequorivita sp.]
LDIGDVCISSITLAELQYGVEKSKYKERNKLALAAFLSSIEILPFSDNAAAEYGRIRANLEKQGNIIGAYDLMIGAHALSENITLVTNNAKEFRRIENLSLENWASYHKT